MVEGKTLKLNKHALFKFFKDESLEAGIVLTGQDVKDFKNNKFEIRDALVRTEGGEAYVYNLHLESSTESANKRKLLLSKREIANIQKTLQNKRMHCYVIRAYLNRGLVKLELGIGTIKRKFEQKTSEKRSTDKRQTEKYISDNL